MSDPGPTERLKAAISATRGRPWVVADVALMLLLMPLNAAYLAAWGVEFTLPLYVFGMPQLRRASGSRMSFGRNLEMRNYSGANVVGVNHKTCLATLARGAELIIGHDVGISGGAIVAQQSVRIGNNVLVGANCMIVDTDFHPTQPAGRRYAQGRGQSRPIEIGDNVFIGANSIILKGTRIGANSVVGAGSVTTGIFDAGSIIAGNPATIRSRSEG